jgi:hypothetical protein
LLFSNFRFGAHRRAERMGPMQACRYLLAVKGGWRDVSRVELDVKAGGLPALVARVEQADRERIAAGKPPDDYTIWPSVN